MESDGKERGVEGEIPSLTADTAVFSTAMQSVATSWRRRRPSNQSEVSTSATHESTASPEARPEQDRAAPARDEETKPHVSCQRPTQQIAGLSQSLPHCAPSLCTQATGEPQPMDRPRDDVQPSAAGASVTSVTSVTRPLRGAYPRYRYFWYIYQF